MVYIPIITLFRTQSTYNNWTSYNLNITLYSYPINISIDILSVIKASVDSNKMETKQAIALTVLAFIASSSIVQLPVKAFPSSQELKGYSYANSNRDVDCSHSINGYKISSPTSCSEFYECVHGVAYLFQCPNMTDGGRLYFDSELQRCNWPSEVDCEIASTEQPETTSVTESSNDQKPIDFELLQRILAPMENSSVDCSQAENGDKIPSPASCSEYFVCVMGNAYLYKCPQIAGGGRLYFDSELGVCNWP